ncbi:hypothetical protein AeRB84_003328 [Aphanomyces euteiches]|nr:hypothetical protein AeRB84_003328 [Aphanomyces euteiches]
MILTTRFAFHSFQDLGPEEGSAIDFVINFAKLTMYYRDHTTGEHTLFEYQVKRNGRLVGHNPSHDLINYTSAAHGLDEDASPSEIAAAFENLKKARMAIQDKRDQVTKSRDRTEPSSQDQSQQPSSSSSRSEFARLFSDNVVPPPASSS